MDLDDLVNAALAQQAEPTQRKRKPRSKPRPKPRPKPRSTPRAPASQSAGLSLEQLIGQAAAEPGVMQAALPLTRPAQQLRLAPDALAALNKARQRTGSSVPSIVYDETLARAPRGLSKWLVDHQGQALAWLRRRLKVPTPTTTPTPHERPYTAEAFAGGGLYDLALTIEGHHITEVVEHNKHAAATLRLNLHDNAVPTDALDWTPAVPKGGLDVLTGGPPCQPWSGAKSLGPGGAKTGKASDENMYPRVLSWVADSGPRIVALENALKITSNPDHVAYFNWWWGQMAILGYEGVTWALRASSYGTPQYRERAIVVAWPVGAPWGEALRNPPPATHGDPRTRAVKSGRLLPWTRVFDRLNSGCCAGWGLNSCVNLGNLDGSCATCVDGMNYEPAPNMDAKQIRRDLNASNLDTMSGLFVEKKTGKQTPRLKKFPMADAGGVWAWEDIKRDERRVTKYLSQVITKNFRRGVPLGLIIAGTDPKAAHSSVDFHDPRARRRFVKQLKIMSIRDAAKIQDVPQWYAFEGGRNASFAQIGNGIPVNMGRAIARHLASALGFQTPLGMAARPFQGLWPTDGPDMCWNAPGVLGHRGTLDFGAAITPVKGDRLRRPHATRQQFDEALAAAQIAEQRLAHGPRQDRFGAWVYDPPSSWVPSASHDVPPGMEDLREWQAWVWNNASDVQLRAWRRLYRKIGLPSWWE